MGGRGGGADCVGAQGLSQEASKSGHPVWVLRRKSAEVVACVALQNLFAKADEAAGDPPKLRREIRLWMFPSEVQPPSLIPRLSPAVLYGPLGILTTRESEKNGSHQPQKGMLGSSDTYSKVIVGVLLSPAPPSETFSSILRSHSLGERRF